MFLFAHVGLTLGAALVVTSVVAASRKAISGRSPQTQPGIDKSGLEGSRSTDPGLLSSIETLGKFLDLRLLVIGSMLPDIIDKPLGILFFGGGRIFTHSLLITLLVLITGIFLYFNYKRSAVLAVSCGMAFHLILDQMWLSPKVFLWPIYGWSFPAGERGSYFMAWLSDLVSVPAIYLTELAGLLVLVTIAAVLINKRKLWTLLKTGCL
ncbi:MAG: metal-dependent hydrolase [Dehalococcoidales bacterium]|nr:metal-dependent hydrolase [Dehalococcoidales bacterium]